MLTLTGTITPDVVPSDVKNVDSDDYLAFKRELCIRVSLSYELQLHNSRNEWGIVALLPSAQCTIDVRLLHSTPTLVIDCRGLSTGLQELYDGVSPRFCRS